MEDSATKAIGANVRQIRLERGYSQEQLAEISQLHRTYIGGIERGERNITVLNLLKVAKALNCKAATLFEGVE